MLLGIVAALFMVPPSTPLRTFGIISGAVFLLKAQSENVVSTQSSFYLHYIGCSAFSYASDENSASMTAKPVEAVGRIARSHVRNWKCERMGGFRLIFLAVGSIVVPPLRVLTERRLHRRSEMWQLTNGRIERTLVRNISGAFNHQHRVFVHCGNEIRRVAVSTVCQTKGRSRNCSSIFCWILCDRPVQPFSSCRVGVASGTTEFNVSR
jgi:hypothetical protein